MSLILPEDTPSDFSFYDAGLDGDVLPWLIVFLFTPLAKYLKQVACG